MCCESEITYSLCQRKDLCVTHIALAQFATEAPHTHTLEVVESVQTGGSVETRVGLTFVYFCLAPETHQQGFNTMLTDRTVANTPHSYDLLLGSDRLSPEQWMCGEECVLSPGTSVSRLTGTVSSRVTSYAHSFIKTLSFCITCHWRKTPPIGHINMFHLSIKQ